MANKFDAFTIFFLAAQVGIAVLYWTTTDYDDDETDPSNNIGVLYQFYIDVAIMIFVGFGFLMTFMRRYAYGAVSFNYLVSVFCVEWAMLVLGFFNNAYAGVWAKIPINVAALINGNFAAGACMITFGALIGKVSAAQMLVIAFFEMIFYGLNYYVCQLEIGLVDIGGTFIIHTFGAYFGLSASMFLSPRKDKAYEHNKTGYNNDIFSMIGTIFLWIMWPSFNGAFGTDESQARAIVNTLLSLTSATMASFLVSRMVNENGFKFDMVHIQNATLAGGVAMGASANFRLGPGGAITLGFGAGLLSVVGFRYIQPFLQRKIGLYDTCGVHNLHGMPGVYGAICSAIACAAIPESNYGTAVFQSTFPQGSNQAGYQMISLLVTLGFGIVGGSLTALFVKYLSTWYIFGGKEKNLPFFLDEIYWNVPEDYGSLQRVSTVNVVEVYEDEDEEEEKVAKRQEEEEEEKPKKSKRKSSAKKSAELPKAKNDNLELQEL